MFTIIEIKCIYICVIKEISISNNKVYNTKETEIGIIIYRIKLIINNFRNKNNV